MTRIEAKKIALREVRPRKVWMLLRFRHIHEKGHDCPYPPYLHVAVFSRRPYFMRYWGGPVCMCDVMRALDGIEEALAS